MAEDRTVEATVTSTAVAASVSVTTRVEDKGGEEEEEEEEQVVVEKLEALSVTATVAASETESKDAESDDSSSARKEAAPYPVVEVDSADAVHRLAALIRKSRRIIVMVGAGISVSAGIPDFRTPGSGLYDNLQKYDLPTPEDIFCLEFFRERPEAFCSLAKELFPGHYRATPTHRFIRDLAERGQLLRCFSQNIDGLELEAGLPADLLVQAHGGFQAAHCVDCHREHTTEFCRQRIMADEVPTCEGCGSYVKPDIVFFGERLPDRFHERAEADFPQCDLLLVIGTSLMVQPFAGLIDNVRPDCPRALINRERVGERGGTPGGIPPALARALGLASNRGFVFGGDGADARDLFYEGDCDDTVGKLVAALAWNAGDGAGAADGGTESRSHM